MSRRTHNNKDTVAFRKELRNRLTPAEAFLRTKRLEKLGNRVFRFENKMVFDNLSSILQEIKGNFKISTT